MRAYNRCFLAELSSYGLLFGTLAYFGASGITGTFSVKVANSCFIVPGLCISLYSFYTRRYRYTDFEENLRDIYPEEI